jgi:glycogen(starch) synthase
MTRILFWCSRFWPHIGGIPVLGTRLVAALRARGHELAVITQRDEVDQPEQDLLGDIPVYRLPFWQVIERRDSAQVQELRRQVLELTRAFQPDIVHTYHIGPEAFFAVHTHATIRCPQICSLHSMYPVEFFRRGTVVSHLLRSATWVVAPSEAILGQVRQELPAVVPRSSLIRNAIDLPPVQPQPLPFEPPRLLCVGRLIEEKGFDLALTAFAVIHARHDTTELVIAGDGPARAALERQARALGIAHAVQFTGWVDPSAVPALINTATLVLMPSRTEGLPLVSLQTAQMARPLVATRVGGLPEVVLDGQTGMLVERDNVTDLVQATLLLLDDPRRAVEMGRAAHAHVAHTFIWERFVDAYDHLYCCVMEQSVCPA